MVSKIHILTCADGVTKKKVFLSVWNQSIMPHQTSIQKKKK